MLLAANDKNCSFSDAELEPKANPSLRELSVASKGI
jgi:hypothetical protein